MRLIIEPTYDAVSRWAANYVASWVFPQGRRLWACINI